MECAKLDSTFESLKESCKSLMDYKVLMEYKFGPEGIPTVEEAQQAIKHAQEIHKFVAGKLKELGY